MQRSLVLALPGINKPSTKMETPPSSPRKVTVPPAPKSGKKQMWDGNQWIFITVE
jgi:hypothetical protein